MKSYYLKLTQDDFVTKVDLGDGVLSWKTDVYDLYDNDQYRNYATRKANYGTNLLGNGIYTGVNQVDSVTSEIGFVDDGRFIDTTGQLDIMRWSIPNFSVSNTADISFSLTTRTSTDEVAVAPYGDWTERTVPLGQDILAINSYRYAFFELTITTPPTAYTIDLAFDIYILIEIDSAVVNGYFSKTLSLLNNFPEWMSIREIDNTAFATPISATPSSLGGQFLNAVAGEWLTDIASKMQYEQYQRYIDSVDLTQKAWAYKVDSIPKYLVSVIGDGVDLARCASIAEFYSTTEDEDAFYWDVPSERLFLTHEYDSLVINNSTNNSLGLGWADSQDAYHLWNALDDLGASVDLFRLTAEVENNDSFKKRILDVYQNKPGVGVEAFKRTLRRELNLWFHMEGATPDSEFLGATPEVLELEDLERDPKYFTPAGIPTKDFNDLIGYLAREYPILWGFLRYDRAFWDPDGLQRKGIKTLDRRLDATPMTEEYLDSGIGDINDLYLFKPEEYTVPQEFTADLVLRGREKTTRQEHPELIFDVSIYGQGDIQVFDNPQSEYGFTIELETPDGIFYSHVIIDAKSDVDINQATPSNVSHAYVSWVTSNGLTNIFYEFRNKDTNEIYADDSATPVSSQVDLSEVTDVTVRRGLYDFDTDTYLDLPAQNDFKLWFDDGDGGVLTLSLGSTLGLGGNTTSITYSTYDFEAASGNFIFETQVSVDLGVLADAWTSDSYTYRINLNGKLPDIQEEDFVLTLPDIAWPDYVTNREIIVSLATFKDGVYGAFTSPSSAVAAFLDSSYLAIDSVDTWDDDQTQTINWEADEITFSSVDGVDYPVQSPVWTLFEETYQDAIQGTVDANGPWRHDEAPIYGSTNEILTYLNISRSDFSIAQTEDYIITHINIANVDNSNVLTWLDTNTIKPAVIGDNETDSNFVYPPNAIEEYYDDDDSIYRFTTFPVKAKLKLGSNKEWYPKVHSGWFHDDVEEFFLYANKVLETTTSAQYTLSTSNRQGAPILITDNTGAESLRQVHFWELDESATPFSPVLTLTNKEVKRGNGSNVLYAAYDNIYNIVVTNKTLNVAVSIPSNTSNTNEIILNQVSNYDYEYEISYKVAKSFMVDNDYWDGSQYTARVTFDKTAAANGYSHYRINYEGSKYDPATPIPVPLNTLYTDFDEGFIYIDHDAYDLQRIELKVTPSKVVASTEDYLLVILEAYDIYGNPKPNVEINLYTNFGILADAVVTTDGDGRAYTTLDSQAWNDSTPADPYPSTPALDDATPNSYPQGLILAETDNSNVTASFDIHRKSIATSKLVAVMESDYILANGVTNTNVLGRVLTSGHEPIVGATVYWRKARTIYELFNSVERTLPNSVTTDSNGRFSVGPFVSTIQAGYWFVSVEVEDNGEYIGDVVYWYEYPDVTISIDPVTGLPAYPIQHATAPHTIPKYREGTLYPVTMDEEVFIAGRSATPSIRWRPPIWYGIDKYIQYHMGLNAIDGYYDTDNHGEGIDYATPSYPDYKES